MFFERSGLHIFSFRGIDVSVSLWYGLLMALVIFFWSGGNIATGVIMALAITLSLLVHEFGHGFMAKRYKLGPSIMLHAFGGFCTTNQEARSDWEDAKVVLAGPLAGLALAGIVALFYVVAPGLIAASPVTATFFFFLLWVNIVWSLVNLLLPIYPLDGGQLFHLILRRFTDDQKARQWTLNMSIFAVIPVAIIGLLVFKSFLLAIFGLFVIMDNVQALQSGRPLLMRSSGSSRAKASEFHEDLLDEAQKAMKDEDWREAARLAHHMRSVGSMPKKMLDQVWTILGMANMEMGEYEEALGYLQRAPKNSKVKRAIERCEAASQDRRPAT